MQKIIGGFFALELPQKIPVADNFLQLWQCQSDNALLLHNARSCLQLLLQQRNIQRLWLPAYLCDSLLAATYKVIEQPLYYAVTSTLSPDCNFLADNLKAGDAILVIDYFGKPPNTEFLQFCKSHPEMIWIEDCAQALVSAKHTWGDWVIYSPRKLLGVPDGGILLNNHKHPFTSPPLTVAPPEFMLPYLWRFEDTLETANSNWYEAYRLAENSIKPNTHSMSQVTRYLLGNIDPQPMMSKRQSNYQFLLQSLHEFCLFQDTLNFVPLGFPLQHVDAERIWQHLCNHRIFAARHWQHLSSPETQFTYEHCLAKQLITLPCDHRYDLHDMQRIINCLLEVLS